MSQPAGWRRSICYLTLGVFDVGGIARYGRYQVAALRRLLTADQLQVLSLLGPDAESFEDKFPVDFAAGGNRLWQKIRFIAATLSRLARRRLYWAAHLHLGPLTLAAARISGGSSIVNIYGWEIWTRPGRLRMAALRRSWVISDCHATLDYAVSRGLVDPGRAAVIWDPVDLDKFRPAKPDPAVAQRYGLVADERFRVMFAGRLASAAQHKNPDVLIRAFAQASLPASAELVIVGEGDRRDYLATLAARLRVSDRVKFLGRVPDADLPALYRLASLFVLVSSRYEGGGEGLPLTPIEASACGVPIVVGGEDGSREAVVNGETGYLIASRDTQALADLLTETSGRPEQLQMMGQAAAQRAADQFSFDRFVEEHRRFLLRIQEKDHDRG